MAPFVRSSVIQGFFAGGAGPAYSLNRSGAPSPQPSNSQGLTLQAQRSSGLVTQAFNNRNAFAVPPHLAGFGQRGGQKLPPAIQQKMESFFRADFSDVQVHSGPEASAIGALAFTHGSNIYFAPGQYNPNSHFGQQLLAHELTHVVQQRAGCVRNPFGSGMAVVHDPALEAEAERMGKQAALFPVLTQASTGNGFSFPSGNHVQRAVNSRVVQRAGGGVAPAVAYTLAAAYVKTEKFANGGFLYERKFTVNPAPATDSIVVQEITRTFNSLELYEARIVIPLSPLSLGISKKGKAPPRKHVLALTVVSPDTVNSQANAAANRYWEVFTVSAGSTDAVPTDDFALTTMAKTTKKPKKLINAITDTGVVESVAKAVYSYRTKGKFTQTGRAVFYENTAIPGGFHVDEKSPAGVLPYTTADPSAGLGHLNHSGPVSITLTATWDSKDKGAKNYGEPNLVIT
jgi:Domain of unknown function (DUF4157)